MTTISGLAAGFTPLSGNEVVPADSSLGAQTERMLTSDIAHLGELYAAANGAAPERFDALGRHFTTQLAGDPQATWFPPTIVTEAGYGAVAQATGGLTVFSRWPITRSATRIWEVEAEVEQVSVGSGESPCVTVGLGSLTSAYAATSGAPYASSVPTGPLVAGQVAVITQRFAASALDASIVVWKDDASAAWFRPWVNINISPGYAQLTTSVARVHRLRVRDVTSLVNDIQRARALAIAMAAAL